MNEDVKPNRNGRVYSRECVGESVLLCSIADTKIVYKPNLYEGFKVGELYIYPIKNRMNPTGKVSPQMRCTLNKDGVIDIVSVDLCKDTKQD